MDTPTKKIILICARDTVVAIVVFYLILLGLDGLLNGFVNAFIPITSAGWLTAVGLIIYLIWWYRHNH